MYHHKAVYMATCPPVYKAAGTAVYKAVSQAVSRVVEKPVFPAAGSRVFPAALPIAKKKRRVMRARPARPHRMSLPPEVGPYD